MKNVNELKRITKVFQQYGIQLTGKRKFDRFEQDLKMDKVFVSGLIFDLEYELHKELADEMVQTVKAPAQLIEMLMN
ncbi:hypothetical protein [Algoriphagus machipongonensis]|uniref:Acyl carrier protein n=1 Tax=Algoriphagus machipongonensis TaxID=388413 RepID=A3HS52_9BACT|nr:hypothetical protein [Algoriphagus machipongonensis]EAZ82670.1 hypothetical protein ALPR1_10655 [Algoriphagus machipongonensis]